MRVVTGFIVLVWSMSIMAAQTSQVSVDRAWGLFIGDVINVTVTLPVLVDDLDPSTLPQADQRYGTWFYLVSMAMQEKQLSLKYQVVNVPRHNEIVTTPELLLTTLGNEQINVPAVDVIIGSLLPTQGKGPSVDLTPKPEHEIQPVDTSETKLELIISALFTMILVLSLVIWHTGWRFKHRKPFAQAMSDLKRLRWARNVEPNQASRILHAAFNKTAGTIVVRNNLEQVFNDVPWLAPLASDINTFYQQSEQHFFQRNTKKEPDIAMVLKLAKACRAKEKLA